MSGTLANMGVVDLLQVMEAGKKSGIVHLSSDPIKSGGFVTEGEERGTIFFRDGETAGYHVEDLVRIVPQGREVLTTPIEDEELPVLGRALSRARR